MISCCGEKVEVNRFPDGTQRILLDPACGRSHSLRKDAPATIEWRYESDDELVTLIYVANHIKEKGGHNGMILVMPYIPNARQDRVKHSTDVFSLKYFAQVINSLGFKRVDVWDPHSAVAEALINNLNVMSPLSAIRNALHCIDDPNIVLYYPDEGAMKRYSALVEKPYVFGIKKRSWETGEIQGLELAGDKELVKGKNVLMVDDICSAGGTFYYGAKELKRVGAKNVYLYVTHCENTIHSGKLLTEDLVQRVFTTRSILTVPHDKIAYVSYSVFG